jgi:anti-sigma-K factor RskA
VAELSHAEIQELLGAYALNAVSPEEAAAVEAHLPACPRCRAEVDEYLETAAMLAGAGRNAPQALWERIDAALEEAPPRLDLAGLRREQRRTGTVGRAMRAVIAVAAVALLILLSLRVMQLDRRVGELAGRDELVDVAVAAANDPANRRLAMRSDDGTVFVNAVLEPDGTGYLVDDNLQPLPESRTYQLWALGGEVPISAGVLGPDPSVVPFRVSPQAGGLAISVERAGGVTEPTQVVVLGELSAA